MVSEQIISWEISDQKSQNDYKEMTEELCGKLEKFSDYLKERAKNIGDQDQFDVLNEYIPKESDEFIRDEDFMSIGNTVNKVPSKKNCNYVSLKSALNCLVNYLSEKLNIIHLETLLNQIDEINKIRWRLISSLKARSIELDKEIKRRINEIIEILLEYRRAFNKILEKCAFKEKINKFDEKHYDNLIGKLLDKSSVCSREFVPVKISYDECKCICVKLGYAFKFDHKFMNNVFKLFVAKAKSLNKHVVLMLTEDNLKEIFGKDIKLSNEEIEERVGEIFASLNIEWLQLEHKNCLTFNSDGIGIFKILIGNLRDLRCFRKINKNPKVVNSLPTSELLPMPLGE